MKFGRLAEYWQRLENVSSRLTMTEILAEMLEEADVDDVDKVVYLSLGKLGPKFDTTEFQLAEKMMMRVIAEVLGVELKEVQGSYKELGDLGNVMLETRGKRQEIRGNTVGEVYGRLMEIAMEGGIGSQERKVSGVVQLMKELDSISQKYVVRMVLGKLRLGFSDMTVLDALSWMICGDKSFHKDLENAYNVRADVGSLVREIKKQIVKSKKKIQDEVIVGGIKRLLKEVSVEWGTPVVAALCQRLETFDEVIEKMGEVACEPKYDGARVQIHFRKLGTGDVRRKLLEQGKTTAPAEVRTFTRNLEENSFMFPELQRMGEQIKADEVVLDAEAMGYDAESGAWLPFQVIMTRKRKHGIDEQALKVPLRFMVFDVLYFKSQETRDEKQDQQQTREGDIHNLPLSERRALLEEIITKGDLLEVVPLELTTDPIRLRELHFEYLKQGLEGVIVKQWSSPYTPGRKGRAWVKMKEVESAEAMLADTLDCVVMGYYRGRGKRADFGMGAFLVGVVDTVFSSQNSVDSRNTQQKNTNELGVLTVSKVGTGLSDEQFRDLHNRLEVIRSIEKPVMYEVHKNLEPDVWVEPGLVVEIAADNITDSQIHTSGMGLRFPRLVKFRDDKDWEDATSIDETRQLYGMQGKKN